MSDELIRKSDVLNLLDDLGLNLINYNIYSQLFNTVDNMPPINAVELPCKAGTVIYVLQRTVEIIDETRVLDFRVSENDVYLCVCGYGYYSSYYIGKMLFLTREEAEKALEDLKNDK